jgi:hypothetical protein
MWKFWQRNKQKESVVKRVVRDSVAEKLPEASTREKERHKLANQRLKELRKQQRQERVVRLLAEHGRKVLVGGVLAVILVTLGLVVTALHSQQVYIIQEIEVAGNERIPKAELENLLAEYKGKSMLLVSKSEITGKLTRQYSYIKNVFVRKVIPGKLYVDLFERKPSLMLINLAGVYLLDDDSYVVGVIHQLEAEGLTFDQAQIVAGYGDINAAIVKEFYLSKITTQEEKDKVKWEEVPVADKESALNEIRIVLNTRLTQQLREGEVFADESDFKELERINSYDNKAYQQGQQVDGNYLTFGIGIRNHFANLQQLKITQMLWESNYLVRVSTEQNKTFYFATTDDIDLQLGKLDAVISNNLLPTGSQFDLRGKKIVVR